MAHIMEMSLRSDFHITDDYCKDNEESFWGERESEKDEKEKIMQ